MRESTLTNFPVVELEYEKGILKRASFNIIEMMDWIMVMKQKVHDLLENNAVCDDCPFRSYCENYPYDCNALDALRELFGKEAK
jgi:hypothetical protein